MFKRLFWLMIGATLGASTSWWVTRSIRQRIERYLPQQLPTTVAAKARSIGSDVRAALADGRSAMHEQEAQLRAQLDRRWG